MTSKTADPTFQMTDTAKIPKTDSGERRMGDVTGGMDLLELDFLLGVVEETKGDDKNDVTMRRLSFDELLRRQNQDRIDSNALAVYAVNKYDLYGKKILLYFVFAHDAHPEAKIAELPFFCTFLCVYESYVG